MTEMQEKGLEECNEAGGTASSKATGIAHHKVADGVAKDRCFCGGRTHARNVVDCKGEMLGWYPSHAKQEDAVEPDGQTLSDAIIKAREYRARAVEAWTAMMEELRRQWDHAVGEAGVGWKWAAMVIIIGDVYNVLWRFAFGLSVIIGLGHQALDRLGNALKSVGPPAQARPLLPMEKRPMAGAPAATPVPRGLRPSGSEAARRGGAHSDRSRSDARRWISKAWQ